MQLLTNELRATIPPLYATEEQDDPIVQCTFLMPWSFWTWHVLEFDGTDTFFGWVEGDYPEYGYFSLSELQSVRGPFGLRIERDRGFTPLPISQVCRKAYDIRHALLI